MFPYSLLRELTSNQRRPVFLSCYLHSVLLTHCLPCNTVLGTHPPPHTHTAREALCSFLMAWGRDPAGITNLPQLQSLREKSEEPGFTPKFTCLQDLCVLSNWAVLLGLGRTIVGDFYLTLAAMASKQGQSHILKINLGMGGFENDSTRI